MKREHRSTLRPRQLAVALLAGALLLLQVAPAYAAAEDPQPTASGQIDTAVSVDQADPVLGPSAELADSDQAQPPASYAPAEAENVIMPLALEQSCGTDLTWNFAQETGTLTISGTGPMDDFSPDATPWAAHQDSITHIVIDTGVTSIGDYAFCECSKLTSVSIADSISSIGEAAFYQCSMLPQITLPAKVKVLPAGTFANCYRLSSVTATGLTRIGNYAFQNTALTTFEVGSALTEISGTAFWNVPVQSFSVAGGNSAYTAVSGVLYANGGKTLVAYPSGKSGDSFTVPDSVTEIADCAFANNLTLRQVQLPTSLRRIGESAFQDSQSLRQMVIPDGVTELGMFAFYGSTVQSLQFGNGLKTIPYECCESCESLTQVTFGTGVTTLENRAFVHCNALEQVTLPANVKEVGAACFGECASLTTFTSKGLTDVSSQMLMNCTNLRQVTLNEGVKHIYNQAFYGCRQLSAITLPKSVVYTDYYPFPTSTKVTCKNTDLSGYAITGFRRIQEVSIKGTQNYKYAFEVLKLINQERKNKGLSALKMNVTLMNAAMNRADEIALCFSHTRPDGSLCFDLSNLMIAENVAIGQRTPAEVVDDWMHSAGHKANILLTDAKTIGIGCFLHNGVYHWTQCFGNGTDTANCAQPANQTVTKKVRLAMEPFQDAQYRNQSLVFGDIDVYQYKFSLKLGSTSLQEKKTTTGTVSVLNPGFTSARAVLVNNSAITWSSSNKNVATVSTAGKVTTIKGGTAKITGKLKYYSPSATLKVSHQYYVSKLTKATVSKSGKRYQKCRTCGNTISTAIPRAKTVKLSKTLYTYDGKIHKPSVTVKDANGKVLKSGTAYTVTYPKGRKYVGKYTVTVKFKGNYTGTKKLTFTIRPKSTKISKLTAGKQKFTVKWNRQSTQTSGYQIRYSTNKSMSGAITKRVSGSKKTYTTVTKRKAKTQYYVQVRTYKSVKVNGKYVRIYSAWSSAKTVTTK